MTPGSLFVHQHSRMRPFAETIAWLWRLGPLLDVPQPGAVGLGWLEEAAELRSLLDRGDLAGAAIFAVRPGPRSGPLPSRARFSNVADFGESRSVFGQFSLLDGGTPAVRSSIGVHAVRDDGWMVFGADPEATWGAVDGFWVLPALADFLVDVLERPLVMLPAVGWVRYDDLPGTAYHLISGRDKPDAKVRRRVERLTDQFGEAGARLNVAIVPRALRDGEDVPVDVVWPESIAALAAGVRQEAIEPVAHGYMHLDLDAWHQRQEIDPREFADVDRAEAERRLDVALPWFEATFGATPRTFVAPTWAYGTGVLEALAQRRLPAWVPPDPGPLVADGNARETLFSTLEGMYRLNYGPLAALAEAGLPPSVIVHGGLFDSRVVYLRKPSEAVTTAKLVLRRDLQRFPWVEGVRWIGAGELLDRLRGHDRIEVEGEEVRNPAGFDYVIRDRNGRRSGS
jgi:hypothetical protein